MKTLNVLLAVLLVAALGAFSVARISAQTSPTSCPSSGYGMMGGQGGHGMLQGMHGPADQAYMQSMMAMHQGMRSHVMTGNADHDFMTMMIPHHQAAIDMAKAELKYGKNTKLRAMARQIIETQEAEIRQMRAMLP